MHIHAHTRTREFSHRQTLTHSCVAAHQVCRLWQHNFGASALLVSADASHRQLCKHGAWSAHAASICSRGVLKGVHARARGALTGVKEAKGAHMHASACAPRPPSLCSSRGARKACSRRAPFVKVGQEPLGAGPVSVQVLALLWLACAASLSHTPGVMTTAPLLLSYHGLRAAHTSTSAQHYSVVVAGYQTLLLLSYHGLRAAHKSTRAQHYSVVVAGYQTLLLLLCHGLRAAHTSTRAQHYSVVVAGYQTLLLLSCHGLRAAHTSTRAQHYSVVVALQCCCCRLPDTVVDVVPWTAGRTQKHKGKASMKACNRGSHREPQKRRSNRGATKKSPKTQKRQRSHKEPQNAEATEEPQKRAPHSLWRNVNDNVQA